MKRVLYALFPGRKEADEAVREVLDAGFAEDQVRLTVHEAPIDRNDLRPAESDARKGLLGGVLLGSLSGSALGFLAAGPLQLLPMPDSIGALAGLALGVVGRGIALPTSGVALGVVRRSDALDPSGVALGVLGRLVTADPDRMRFGVLDADVVVGVLVHVGAPCSVASRNRLVSSCAEAAASSVVRSTVAACAGRHFPPPVGTDIT